MIKATKNWAGFDTGLYFFKKKNGETFIGKHIFTELYPVNVMTGLNQIDTEECLMIVPTYEDLKDEKMDR